MNKVFLLSCYGFTMMKHSTLLMKDHKYNTVVVQAIAEHLIE